MGGGKWEGERREVEAAKKSWDLLGKEGRSACGLGPLAPHASSRDWELSARRAEGGKSATPGSEEAPCHGGRDGTYVKL